MSFSLIPLQSLFYLTAVPVMYLYEFLPDVLFFRERATLICNVL